MDLQRFLEESLRSKNKREDEHVLVLFARSLVLCFGPHLCAHIICYFKLKTTSFGFFTLALLCAFKEKISIITVIMLYMDDALDEKAVLIIFGELEVRNSPL